MNYPDFSDYLRKEELSSPDLLRCVSRWLDYQDESFNDLFTPFQLLELYYCTHVIHDLEFADDLNWEDESDEEYFLAQDVNRILGRKYYAV